MIVKLTKADLMKGQTITQGWYKAQIINFVCKPPKNSNDSMNYIPTFKLEDGPHKDAELDRTFNSKAIGMMGPFIAAVEEKNLQDIMKAIGDGTLEFDTEASVGKKLQIKIINEPYEGRLVNKVEGFLPYNDNATVPF